MTPMSFADFFTEPAARRAADSAQEWRMLIAQANASWALEGLHTGPSERAVQAQIIAGRLSLDQARAALIRQFSAPH